ncbi:MAG: hypothetical protein JSW28_02790, partial [Thermoplasmata archaeon]
AGDSYINITGCAPLSDGSAVITNYTIYKANTSGYETFLIEIGDIFHYNDTDVTNNVTYYYKITARNAIGEGAFSNEINATVESTTQEPEQPTDSRKDLSSWFKMIVITFIAIMIIALLAGYMVYRKRKRQLPPQKQPPSKEEPQGFQPQQPQYRFIPERTPEKPKKTLPPPPPPKLPPPPPPP